MPRSPAGEMLDLHPTRETGGDHHGFGVGISESREKSLLANQARDFVMFLFVTKRTSHAAATCVKIDHVGAWDAPKESQGWLHAGERALMTMPLHEDLGRSGRDQPESGVGRHD